LGAEPDVTNVARVDNVKRGNRLRAVLAVIAVGGHLLSMDAVAEAAPPSSESKLQTLRDQVEEASAEEAALLDRIDASHTRRRELDGQVAALERDIAAVAAELEVAQRRFDELQMQVVAIEQRLTEARVALAEAKEDLRRRAVAAYMGTSDVNAYADLVLQSRDMRELAASSGYLKAVMHAQTNAVDRHKQLRDEVEGLRTKVEETRLGAMAERDAIANRHTLLEQRRRAVEALRAQLRNELASQAQTLEEIQARKGEFEAQIAALQVTSDGLTVLLRGRQAGQTAAAPGRGVLAKPVAGPVTSTFGPRVHPIFGNVRVHAGVDFSAAAGASITAAGDGVVVLAGPYGGYGNATVIDHGNALATLYGHQSSILVGPGERVTRGQVIGRVGCTGYCTGPHLHFEVRLYGTPVDPLGYL
jgi:murein DD-endopeptidase MepM/ murein hydrolase activator NlpD